MSKMSSIEKQESEEKMRKQEASRISPTKFCREHQIHRSVFYY